MRSPQLVDAATVRRVPRPRPERSGVCPIYGELLTRDEARRIAVDIAMLPGLVGKLD
jgi:hypothetical protein